MLPRSASGRAQDELVPVGVGELGAFSAPAQDGGTQPKKPVNLVVERVIGLQHPAQPTTALLGSHGRAAPGDLRAALRRLNRRFPVRAPYQRPLKGLTPEVADLARSVPSHCTDSRGIGEEAVAWLDDTELVALRVSKHHMAFVPALADVEVSGSELKRRVYAALLILGGGTGQVEVHPVQGGLGGVGRDEPKGEVGARPAGQASVGQVDVAAEDARPEARQFTGIERVQLQ